MGMPATNIVPVLQKNSTTMATKSTLYSTFCPGNSRILNNFLYFPSSARNPPLRIACKVEVDTEKLKRRLIKKGYVPTPKIIHRLRKKEIQKTKRKAKKNPEKEIPEHVKREMEEEAVFEAASREFEMLMAELEEQKRNNATRKKPIKKEEEEDNVTQNSFEEDQEEAANNVRANIFNEEAASTENNAMENIFEEEEEAAENNVKENVFQEEEQEADNNVTENIFEDEEAANNVTENIFEDNETLTENIFEEENNVPGNIFEEEKTEKNVTGNIFDKGAAGLKLEGKPWERGSEVERRGRGASCGGGRRGGGHGVRVSVSDGKGIRVKVSDGKGIRIRGGIGKGKGKGKVIEDDDFEEFREMLARKAKGELSDLYWLLDNDLGDGVEESVKGRKQGEVRERPRAPIDEEKQIQWITERLNSVNFKMPTWQLSKLMHSARMKFTDGRMVRIVQILGDMGKWRQAVEIVHWVHNRKRYKYCKGRYVYTSLLAVLGKARRPVEAMNVFHAMREHISSYPDMPAYRCIANILGKAGYLKVLLNIIDCLRRGPAKLMNNVKFLHWDPRLQPDLVVYNAVLNACIPWQEWKGAIWVLQQIRQNGLRPSCATYGLTIEVMLASGKYDLVHIFFEKMRKAGLPPNASNYKAIVCAFWKEGKIDEAVMAVEEMKSRGVIPTAGVYYELACGLCSAGRWQDALLQVEKLCKCPPSKPLAVTFTGLIRCCAEAGHIHHCTSIFEYMQEFFFPNIGTVNAMIKAYGQNSMFEEAKILFEGIKKGRIGLQNPGRNDSRLSPDIFTYKAMLEACAMAQEWEYLDNVYKQMVLHGHSLDHRYAWLIVAASRAGKSHLLDHAFVQLLEQGKIPHISIYKEKICQSLRLEEYAKAINYINSMAKVSMDISQNEWTELFKKNASCASKDMLQELLDELITSISDDNLRCSPIFGNLIASIHLLSRGNVSSEPIKFINNSGTMRHQGESHSYANSVSADEIVKVIRDTQDQKDLGYSELHDQNREFATGKSTLNLLGTDVIGDDVNNLLGSHLPSSYEILREWRQDVKEKSFVLVQD